MKPLLLVVVLSGCLPSPSEAPPVSPGPDTAADSGGPDSAGTADSAADTASSAAGLVFHLTWPQASDLDLHVMDQADSLFTEHDCSFCNAAPDWGAAGSGDDPALDLDQLGGAPGEETTTITSPATGTYYVAVHYYEDNGETTTDATVEVRSAGVVIATSTLALERNEVWTVGSVSYPDLTVTLDTDLPVNATVRTCE